MTKGWISTSRLAREEGISWIDAEQIIREESSGKRRHGRFGLLLNLCYVACLLWILGIGRWLFPELQGLAQHSIGLAVIAVMVATLFVPRLLAHDAILARARDHATGRATQNN